MIQTKKRGQDTWFIYKQSVGCKQNTMEWQDYWAKTKLDYKIHKAYSGTM